MMKFAFVFVSEIDYPILYISIEKFNSKYDTQL